MVTNGESGNIGADGANDDRLETMMIQRSYNGGNADNNANGDTGFNGVNGQNDSIGDIDAIVAIGVIVTIGTIIRPMDRHCF